MHDGSGKGKVTGTGVGKATGKVSLRKRSGFTRTLKRRTEREPAWLANRKAVKNLKATVLAHTRRSPSTDERGRMHLSCVRGGTVRPLRIEGGFETDTR